MADLRSKACRLPTENRAPFPPLPSQALPNGANYAPAILPLSTKASAMFSLSWPQGRAPASVGSPQVQAFVAALKAYLPGAAIHVVRHVSECTCTTTCGNRLRALLSNVGQGWFSQPACQGRVIFNTVVAHPDRQRLMQLVRTVERQPGAVWSQGKVGASRLGVCHRDWMLAGVTGALTCLRQLAQ